MKNILVGIDFHEKTAMLLEKATELSKPFASKVWLIHIAAPDPDFVGYEAGPQFIRDERAQELKKEHQLLHQYKDQLKQKGITTEALLIQGATTDKILEESKKLNIDLIIFGHHKHSFLHTAFFGSHSTELIKRSTVPILVVPFGA